jgi:hypothetical protein
VEFATKQNVPLTATPPAAGTAGDQSPPPVALDAKGKQKLASLRSLRGAKFDRGFVSAMAQGHQEALDLLKAAKDKVDHDGFDALTTDLQGPVEKHLEHARQLQAESTSPRAAAPGQERSVQGRRPPPPPAPEPMRVPEPRVPDPSRMPDPATPDPMRAPDPTRPPDPTLPPSGDPTRTPTPNPVPAPTPQP